MRDLVDIMHDENTMMNLGFAMLSDDIPKADLKNEDYITEGVSTYSLIVSSSTTGSSKYMGPIGTKKVA